MTNSPLPWRIENGKQYDEETPLMQILANDIDLYGEPIVVCDNRDYYPQAVKPEDQALIVRAVNAHAELSAKIEALESLRPHWARGYSSDSIAAQAMTCALSDLWSYLGASSQTDAEMKLRNMKSVHAELVRVLEACRDHIIGTTGARNGSDSAEMVQDANTALKLARGEA